jgi:tetraacyldisaccharide 4'-kinase
MASNQKELFLIRWWYQKSPLLYFLLPLSLLYFLITKVRRWLYSANIFSSYRAPVPVIIVGNVTVGGTGKTPVVIALVTALQRAGYKPGVISRGYGSNAPRYPFPVYSVSDPTESGDEPLLIAQRCSVPVVIDPIRKNAAQYLLDNTECNVIVTDDGLQHYALQRDIEIVVVDGARGFANRLVLPAGPLRETVNRLRTVDYIITNGNNLNSDIPDRLNPLPPQAMFLQPLILTNVKNSNEITIDDWSYSKKVHAVAAIGNPQRFYQTLRQLGFVPIEHSFEDHHQFSAEDLQFDDDLPIIMTEKDAVKVARLNPADNFWYLVVEAIIDEKLYNSVIAQLDQLSPKP